MKNKKTLLAVIVILVLLLGGAYGLYNALAPRLSAGPLASTPTAPPAPSDPTEPVRIPMPDATVYDANGNPVQLKSFIGKPIVLNFWASWCGPCRQEMPVFQKAYEALGEEIHFLMVNATGGRETMASAQRFLAGTDYSFPVLFDTASQASQVYYVYALPTTYFIDAEGYLVTYASGALTQAYLEAGISAIYTP